MSAKNWNIHTDYADVGEEKIFPVDFNFFLINKLKFASHTFTNYSIEFLELVMD